MRKVRIGVSFDEEVARALDEQVGLSPDLAMDRSEVVNTILKGFFRAGIDHKVKTRELIILNRNGHLEMNHVHAVHTEPSLAPITA